MDILERLGGFRTATRQSVDGDKKAKAEKKVAEAVIYKLKKSIHRRIVDTVDLSKISSLEGEFFKAEVTKALKDIINTEPGSEVLNAAEKNELVRQVCDEMLGLGPIEHLLADSTIADILVNDPKHVFIERNGKLELTDIVFQDDNHLMHIIERIVTAVGRRIDESSPMVDARLPDGSRVNAIIPPLAIDGPVLSIRKFGTVPLTAKDLLKYDSVTEGILDFLSACVRAKANILVSGGTGSGKTTLLNVLSSYIPNNERIITIEDSAELQLQQDHVVRLETRPANIEGKGEVNQRDLLRNCLRMRPNRIIVGEVRGAESLDMLQAMNTGHDGSLSTIHANSPRDALTRLEVMCIMTGLDMPVQAIRYYISSAVNFVVQVSRLSDGSRKVVDITELTGMEGPVITASEIFRFAASGVGSDGKVRGELVATGIRPRFVQRMEEMGIEIASNVFKGDPKRRER